MRKREQGMAQNIVIKDILLVMGRRIMKAPKELLCEDPGLAEIRGKTDVRRRIIAHSLERLGDRHEEFGEDERSCSARIGMAASGGSCVPLRYIIRFRDFGPSVRPYDCPIHSSSSLPLPPLPPPPSPPTD